MSTGRRAKARRVVLAPLAMLVFAAGAAGQTFAITNEFGRDFDHPFVGLVVLSTDVFITRCTGELLAPTIFLTAGHCAAIDTFSDEDGPTLARVWFQQDAGAHFDPDAGVDPVTGYPSGCATGTLGALCATGTHVFDYGFVDGKQTDSHDVGLIVLDQAIHLSEYASLPAPGTLDALATSRGTLGVDFTVSGYGLSHITHRGDVVNLRERLEATSSLVSLRDALIDGWGMRMIGDGQDRGGTCLFDSGGPVFWPPDSNQVVAIDSFGQDRLCRAVDGEYRLDRAAVISWILDKAGSAAGQIVHG